jgi:alpha-L-fucosidase
MQSAASTQNFDIAKEKWRVVAPDPVKDPRVEFIIDDNAESIWRSAADKGLPQEIIIDLGENLMISGFTYLPTQQRYIDGTVSEYQFFVSPNGNNWGKPVSEGEFSNIKNNPILQTKTFVPAKGRYIKFTGNMEIEGKNFMSVAEVGIITE